MQKKQNGDKLKEKLCVDVHATANQFKVVGVVYSRLAPPPVTLHLLRKQNSFYLSILSAVLMAFWYILGFFPFNCLIPLIKK